MTQTNQISQNEEVNHDQAFRVDEVNLTTGETVLIIQKGIIGAMANQLKSTNNKRKGASILRKMGHMLSACGDAQYGAAVDGTGLDPSIIETHEEPYGN